MTRYITLTKILSIHRCSAYPDDRVRELFGTRRRVTLRTIATAPIPAADRLWVLIRLMPECEQRLFACDCAERALTRERDAGREPDARSWRAIEVSRLYADGKATAEELKDVRDAAWAACDAADAAWDAADAAWDAAAAAWDAAAAAWHAACDAAWAAAGDAARAAGDAAAAAWDAAAAAWAAGDAAAAEREWQVARAVEMLEVQL